MLVVVVITQGRVACEIYPMGPLLPKSMHVFPLSFITLLCKVTVTQFLWFIRVFSKKL